MINSPQICSSNTAVNCKLIDMNAYCGHSAQPAYIQYVWHDFSNCVRRLHQSPILRAGDAPIFQISSTENRRVQIKSVRWCSIESEEAQTGSKFGLKVLKVKIWPFSFVYLTTSSNRGVWLKLVESPDCMCFLPHVGMFPDVHEPSWWNVISIIFY